MTTRLPSKHITFQKHPIALKDPFETGRQWCALCTVHNRNMEKIKKDAALMRTITHQRSFTSYQQSNSRGGNMECLMDRHESTSQHGSEATYEKRGGGSSALGIQRRIEARKSLAVKRRQASRASAQLMESRIT